MRLFTEHRPQGPCFCKNITRNSIRHKEYPAGNWLLKISQVGKRKDFPLPCPPNYVRFVWAKPDELWLWQVSWPRRSSPTSSFLFQTWISNFLLFPSIFRLPHFLRQCFFKWVSRILVLELPGVLVKNGDSWSYSKRFSLNSSGGVQESAFLTIPQVILVPTEKQV